MHFMMSLLQKFEFSHQKSATEIYDWWTYVKKQPSKKCVFLHLLLLKQRRLHYLIDVQYAHMYGITLIVCTPNIKYVPILLQNQIDFIVYQRISEKSEQFLVPFTDYHDSSASHKIAVTKLSWPDVKIGCVIDKLRGVVHNIPSMKSVEYMFLLKPFCNHTRVVKNNARLK